MSTPNAFPGDIQDESQGSCSHNFDPDTYSPGSTFDFGSTMQIQPQDAPKSPRFGASSPPPASSDAAASTVPPSASPPASPPPEVCSKDAAGPPDPNAESYFMHPEVLALMACSTPPASSDAAVSTVPPSASPPASPPPEVCSKDAAGPPGPNAESYFMHPEVLALMACSTPPASSDAAVSTVPPSASPPASPPPEVCSKDAAGPPGPNAESYFMHPEVLALMAGSTSPASSDAAVSTVPPPASPPPEVCSNDAAGPPYLSAESYFMRPEVLTLMAGSPKEPKLPIISTKTTTNRHLAILNKESGMRGLTPRFEIEGNQRTGFGGNVKIGEKTITSEEKYRSKKAAKEGLAEIAGGVVKAMPGQKRKRVEENEENWIGLLHRAQLLPIDHYRPTLSTAGGPIFLEYSNGSAFACTCKVPGHPNQFGSDSSPLFPNKKAARSNAAKEVMQFLFTHGLASPDGNCKKLKSKKAKLDAAAAMAEDTEATFTKKVNEVCPLLCLPTPEYRILSPDSSPPNIFSGAAYFPASTTRPGLLPTLGPIGSVKDVLGKKEAKKQCAKLVLEFLTEWMKTQAESKTTDDKEASG